MSFVCSRNSDWHQLHHQLGSIS